MSERPLVGSTKVELVQAHLGTVSLMGIGGSPVKVGLRRTVLHPQYNPSILDFDVALLELSWPLVFNKYIQPVCLPLAIQKFPVGRKCMISGWGNTQEGNGESPEASLLPLPAVPWPPLSSRAGGLQPPAQRSGFWSVKFYWCTAVPICLRMARGGSPAAKAGLSSPERLTVNRK